MLTFSSSAISFTVMETQEVAIDVKNSSVLDRVCCSDAPFSFAVMIYLLAAKSNSVYFQYSL